MIQEHLARWIRLPGIGILAFAGLKALGLEIPRSTEIGPGLELAHGAVGLVLHPRARIGSSVRLYQGVTIGRADVYLRDGGGGGVTVGDLVIIGANATVLFKSGQTIVIGERSVIGAGSVVVTDVPAGEIWAGSPARRVGIRPTD